MPKPTELEDFIAVASRPDATESAKALLRLVKTNPIVTPKVFHLACEDASGPDQEAMNLRLYQLLNVFLVQAHDGVPDMVKAAQSRPRESWERQGHA